MTQDIWGNRVFAHLGAEISTDDPNEKEFLKRIHRIRLAGFDVAYVTHRHGMLRARPVSSSYASLSFIAV